MMSIRVRFFASLRERVGRTELELPAGGIGNVADVWRAAAGADLDAPAKTLAAINMEYCDFEAPVGDGDEVAFFPPVTGG
jgi:molybdopterin synthase sulfur carrier subunit